MKVKKDNQPIIMFVVLGISAFYYFIIKKEA
ncbi:hypothetical protein HNP21_006251 [Bacillus aryabhattai]|uniref:Uncharacterized protein n=1 Tax=Priestia aryabhattai TaxID=412384 RepID=A0A7W3NHD9_PRIAR|nr:hypothetical protein [Priestia aryabhattai]